MVCGLADIGLLEMMGSWGFRCCQGCLVVVFFSVLALLKGLLNRGIPFFFWGGGLRMQLLVCAGVKRRLEACRLRQSQL